MANKAFINTDVWKDDEIIKLSVDAKLVYFSLLIGEREYIDVFKLHRNILIMMTGLNERQLEVSLGYLEEAGFVEVYNGYIGIKKSYAAKLNGFYNDINSKREYEKLPVDIREHFYPDGEEVIVTVKPKKVKTGPKPETIKDIISKQPEALRESLQDFVDDRIERKKAPTTRAVKGWITKLETMYPNNPAKQALSLQQSIERSWMGLFEVKSDDKDKGGFM